MVFFFHLFHSFPGEWLVVIILWSIFNMQVWWACFDKSHNVSVLNKHSTGEESEAVPGTKYESLKEK